MWPAVGVHIGHGRGQADRSRFCGEDRRVGQEGGLLQFDSKFVAERTEDATCSPVAHQAACRGVPEQGGTPIAQCHLVAIRCVVQLGQPGSQLGHDLLDGSLAV